MQGCSETARQPYVWLPFRGQSSRFLMTRAGITDVGDTPFPMIKEVLAAMSSEQLAEVEELSPHLLAETERTFVPFDWARRQQI